jgi:hypothetical protein
MVASALVKTLVRALMCQSKPVAMRRSMDHLRLNTRR